MLNEENAYKINLTGEEINEILMNSSQLKVIKEGGITTGIAYSDIQDYEVIIIYGYKNNIAAPNQICFPIIVNQLNSSSESNFLVNASALSGTSNWQYRILFNLSNNVLTWKTDLDFSGNSEFVITKIVGLMKTKNQGE